MYSSDLLSLRDKLRSELRRLHVAGVEGVSIGGRGGDPILIILVNDTYKDGEAPEEFLGIGVEVENIGVIEQQ